MSYCRWSSDFGECDVYVYEDVNGGWTTHVAGRRLKHLVPDEIKAMHRAVKWSEPDAVERFMAANDAEKAWRHSLPCDETPCNYMQADGTLVPGIDRQPKASEYISLSQFGEEAGDSFNDETPDECADRLEALRSKGFNVPQYAIDALRKEAKEDPQP